MPYFRRYTVKKKNYIFMVVENFQRFTFYSNSAYPETKIRKRSRLPNASRNWKTIKK